MPCVNLKTSDPVQLAIIEHDGMMIEKDRYFSKLSLDGGSVSSKAMLMART